MSPPTLLHLAALMGLKPPATGDLKIPPFDFSWHRGKNKTKRQAGFKTFLTKAIKTSEEISKREYVNFLLCPPGMQVAVDFLPLALRLEIGGFGFISDESKAGS